MECLSHSSFGDDFQELRPLPPKHFLALVGVLVSSLLARCSFPHKHLDAKSQTTQTSFLRPYGHQMWSVRSSHDLSGMARLVFRVQHRTWLELHPPFRGAHKLLLLEPTITKVIPEN
ncbi:hypothetical protein WA026_017012 [Henosepilachna vigintioctopunctata]|uniref:Uncharacterized protein n=1 Tax=Henosepilachna vigintioctopunctata TaxID=420089 RepID=A0AAW1TPJ1_9CUCU